jgi:hypothetical protein
MTPEASHYDIIIKKEISHILPQIFQTLKLSETKYSKLKSNLEKTYQLSVKKIIGVLNEGNNWFSDMASNIESGFGVSEVEKKYSKTLIEKCKGATNDINNQFVQNFIQAHKVEFRGFGEAGNSPRARRMEAQKNFVEMKVRRLVNRIFRGLNRLKDVSSQNWDSIMNEFDKGWH